MPGGPSPLFTVTSNRLPACPPDPSRCPAGWRLMGCEVVDAAGRRVRLPALPSRIISLVPSITETLFALGLGDRLVGVTRFCTEPSAGGAGQGKGGGPKGPPVTRA